MLLEVVRGTRRVAGAVHETERAEDEGRAGEQPGAGRTRDESYEHPGRRHQRT